MDKYRRNDDSNDDLDVYNQENYEGMSIKKSYNYKPILNVQGSTEADEECKDRVKEAMSKLSPQESKLMNLILSGKSIRKSSKLMGISQQMAQKYWERIKTKLK